MDCIGCETEDAFNRVIVNQVSSEEIALYCEECEREDFGSLLDNPSWHQENGCAFCDNPGTYILPYVDCLIEDHDGTAKNIEYMVFDDVTAICESHLRELVSNETVLEELMASAKSGKTTVKV